MLLNIKEIIILVSILFSLNTYSQKISDFKVIKQPNGDHLLFKKDLEEVFIKLKTTGTNFKLHKIFKKPSLPNLIFVEYRSVTVGTSALIDLYRSAVFNKKRNLFIGDLPSSKEFKGKSLPYEWIVKEGKIYVSDNNKVIKILSVE